LPTFKVKSQVVPNAFLYQVMVKVWCKCIVNQSERTRTHLW